MKEIIIPDTYKYISAFLTFRCNLACSYCLNKFSESFNPRLFEEISGKQWTAGLNRIKSRKDVPITFSGGEPSMHKEYLEIINNLSPELNIDILTNMYDEEKTKQFLKNVSPNRIKRDSKYPSIRVSYHPEQMDADVLIGNVKKLQGAGFSIGIYAVQHPSSSQLEAITQMQFKARDANIDFRLKDFTGIFDGKDDNGKEFKITYGNYSKYQNSAFQEETKNCECKTSELLIGPNGNVYRCHRDLYSAENPIGSILDESFQLEDKFRKCSKYGNCHPCDVKVKTNFKQQFGHTSVEIKNVEDK